MTTMLRVPDVQEVTHSASEGPWAGEDGGQFGHRSSDLLKAQEEGQFSPPLFYRSFYMPFCILSRAWWEKIGTSKRYQGRGQNKKPYSHFLTLKYACTCFNSTFCRLFFKSFCQLLFFTGHFTGRFISSPGLIRRDKNTEKEVKIKTCKVVILRSNMPTLAPIQHFTGHFTGRCFFPLFFPLFLQVGF